MKAAPELRPGRTRWAWAIVAFACLAVSCSRSDKHPVTRVEAVGGTLQENGLLGLGRDQVEEELRRALTRSGKFELLAADARKKKELKVPPVILSLDLPFTREAKKEGRDGTWAEVGATLVIRRKVDGQTHRYDVAGLGEVQIQGEQDRGRAMQAALSSALAQVTESTHLQLSALQKSDEALLRDLREGTSMTQEFALRVLSERQNPAVAEILIERLGPDRDLDQARQAMGALAEMRERRAVKPLIEATRGKDAIFVREVLFALAQIGGEDAMAYLFTVAQGHDDEALRTAAQKALAELEARERGKTAQHGGER